jgi:hypothetical protein
MKAILAIALVSMLIVISFAGIVTANPVWLGKVPPDADTKPPYITIFSPENNSQINSSISINLKVGVGESKTATSSVIDIVSYKADWIENIITIYNDSSSAKAHIFYTTLLNLTNIPEGSHSIVINVVEKGSYLGSDNLKGYTFTIQNSALFSFSNNLQVKPTATVPEYPITAIIPILGAILTGTFILRFKIHKEKQE